MITHIKQIISLFFLMLPIRKRTIIIQSFGGQYNDNPKYISEELYRTDPSLRIIWVKGASMIDLPPEYIKVVQLNSWEYFYWRSVAEVVVNNVGGLRGSQCKKNNIFANLYLKIASKKKKGQLCLSTWHGTPLKKIGNDSPDSKFYNTYRTIDFLLSGCKHTSACLRTAIGQDIPIMEIGTPRNDNFFKQYNIDELKKKLGLPIGKKIVLYAPTFRNSIEMSGAKQMEDLKIDILLDCLNNKFSGDFAFAFRLHYHVLRSVDINRLKKVYGEDCIFNGNEHDDMAEYLLCSDVLISDYSSSMFDFMLTARPIFMYAPDIESYGSDERGFYIPITELPFPVSKTFDGLLSNIKSFDASQFEEDNAKLLNKLGNLENGRASKQAVEKLLGFINRH